MTCLYHTAKERKSFTALELPKLVFLLSSLDQILCSLGKTPIETNGNFAQLKIAEFDPKSLAHSTSGIVSAHAAFTGC